MTESLAIPSILAGEMIAHCLEGRPNEACGAIAIDGSDLVKVFRITNAAASPVRYAFDAKEYQAVWNEIFSHGWDLGALYHSHTRTEAYPSPTDVKEAREDVPYVIVSLATEPPVIRAFRIVKDDWLAASGDVAEIPAVVTG